MHQPSQTQGTSTTENTSIGTKRSTSDGEKEKSKPKKRRKKTATEKPDGIKFDSFGVLLEGKERYRVKSDVNYIGMCHVAVARHPNEFTDLKFEPASQKKSAASLHGMKATVWTRDEDGKKTTRLRCRKHAKTKKAAQRAAAGGLLTKMLEINRDLSYEGNTKVKESKAEDKDKDNGNSNGNGNGDINSEVLELNTTAILNELHRKDIIMKKAEFRTVLNGLWEASCTVDIEDVQKKNKNGKAKSIPYSAEAKHRKKNHAMRLAAKDIIDQLIEDGVKGVKEVLHAEMFPRSKDGEKEEDCDGDGDDEEGNTMACLDDGDDEEYEEDVYETAKSSAFSAWLNNPGDEFRVPEGYVISIARSGSECKEFIDEHEEEKIGVYLESPDVYKSILYGRHYFEKTRDEERVPIAQGECKVIALAVESGAMLLIEPIFPENEKWPPASLVNLFRNTHAELCGYKLNGGGHALGFTPEHRHCISDIQTVANGLKNGRELRHVIHLPLVDIVRNWTGKRLAENFVVLDTEHVDGVHGKRAKTAIHTAAAVLAAYHSMCIERDAKIRKQIGNCAMRGFNDLMNVLGGKTQLFPIT